MLYLCATLQCVFAMSGSESESEFESYESDDSEYESSDADADSVGSPPPPRGCAAPEDPMEELLDEAREFMQAVDSRKRSAAKELDERAERAKKHKSKVESIAVRTCVSKRGNECLCLSNSNMSTTHLKEFLLECGFTNAVFDPTWECNGYHLSLQSAKRLKKLGFCGVDIVLRELQKN